VLEAEKTSLMLLNEEGTELRVAATVGRDLSIDEMDAVPLGQGVAGFALESSEPLVVESVSGDARFANRTNQGRYQSESFAVAPLEVGDRPLGVLCATDRISGEGFRLEDLSLLRLLATQISELMAVGRESVSSADEDEGAQAAPEDVTQALDIGDRGGELARDAELARLVCDAMVNDVEPERVIGAILKPLVHGLPAAPVSLYLIDAATGVLKCEGQCDGGVRADRPELPKSSGLTGLVLQTGHLVAAQQPHSDLRFDPEVDTPEDGGVGPLLCLPLRLRGKVVGVVRAFLPADVEVSARTGEVLAAVLSAAVRNVLLYRSLIETIEDVAEARREARG
jgi:GAF domain-containing protein